MEESRGRGIATNLSAHARLRVQDRSAPVEPATLSSSDAGSGSLQPVISRPAALEYAQPPQSQRKASDLNRLIDALEGCNTDAAVQAALANLAPTCRPTPATLTKLIAKYSKGGYWRRGLAVFKHLRLLSVLPDVGLTNTALWACKRGGDADQAWLIFARMRTEGITPDVISYRALFPVLAAAGKWQACVLGYLVVLKDNTQLDGLPWLFMLLALRRAGLWSLAETCLLTGLSVPLARGQQGCPHPFISLLEVRRTEPECARAPAEYLKISHSDKSSDSCSVRVLHQGVLEHFWAHCTATERAATLHAAGRAPELQCHAGGTTNEGGGGSDLCDGVGLRGDALVSVCCNVVLQMHAEACPPQPARALALLHAMARFRDDNDGCALQPDVLSHGLVALAHCRAGLVVEGMAVLTAFACWQPGHRPVDHHLTAVPFAQCMAATAAAGDATGVTLIWLHMATLAVPPDDACIVAFICASAQVGRPELCEEAVTWALTLSCEATDAATVQQAISCLLVSLAQHGPPTRAVAVFQQVLATGIKVTAACVAEAVRCLEPRDASCCAALRQTVAAAGFKRGSPPPQAASVARV